VKEFSFLVIPDIELGRPHFDLCDAGIWDPFRRKKRVVKRGIERRLAGVTKLLPEEVKFAITVGDLTDSALPEQFSKVKEILADELLTVLVVGNHDLWPFRKLWDPILSWKHYEETDEPIGLKIFEEIFRENLQQLSEFFNGWQKQKSSFLNYTFLYNDVRFIVIDNMSRHHAILGFPGTIGFPHLYPETKDWLQKQLSQEEKIKIIISHSPLKRELLEALSGDAEIINIAGHHHRCSLRKSNNITTFVTGALYLEPVVTVVKILLDKVQFCPMRIP